MHAHRLPLLNSSSALPPMSSLQVEPFVFDCPPTPSAICHRNASDGRLKITAKRYTLENSADNAEGFTLLFAHCIGSRKSGSVENHSGTDRPHELKKKKDKEQWEPTISRLFHQQKHKCAVRRIREAWSFDWQNHGDAAILNQKAIESLPDCICTPFVLFWCFAYSQHSSFFSGRSCL